MTLNELRVASRQHGGYPTLMKLSKRCVTWRRYGLSGELRRPMVHRFEVKGGDKLIALVAENVTRSNALFHRLSKR